MVLGSSPAAVTSPSDFASASSKEFLVIQATIECGFTLKRVRYMTRTYSHPNHVKKFLSIAIIFFIWLNQAINNVNNFINKTKVSEIAFLWQFWRFSLVAISNNYNNYHVIYSHYIMFFLLNLEHLIEEVEGGVGINRGGGGGVGKFLKIW